MLGETAHLAVDLNLTGNFNKEIGKATASVKGVAVQTKSLSSQIKGSVLTGVGLGAGFVGFQLLAKGVGLVNDAIDSAVRDEASVALLTRSIEENSEAWDGNIGAIESVIKARQALAFTDDEQRDSLRLLVSLTKDVDEALRVQRIAMDFARLKGIDLATATGVLGKVYGGNIGILTRYGIQLRKGATATEALAEIQKRAAGQAEVFANTTGGKAAVAAIKFSEAMESVGRIAVPVVGALADGLSGVADVVDMLTTAGGGGGSLDGLITDLRRTAGALSDTADAAKDSAGEWAGSGTAVDSFVDGLNALQNTAADLGLLPNLVKKNEWHEALSDVQEQLGKTDDEMSILIDEAERLGLTLDQTRQSLTGAGVVAGGVKAWHEMGAAMAEATRAAFNFGETADDTTKDVRQLTFSQFDAAEAAQAAAGGFRKQRDSLRDLIRTTSRLRHEDDQTYPRATRLLEDLRTAHRKQAQAAADGRADVVASYQAQINKIEQMLGPLRAALALTIKLRAQAALVPALEETFGVFGGGGGGGGGKKGRASGGLVAPYSTYIVGENGPEVLSMGGNAGRVSQMGAGDVSVTVGVRLSAFQVNREIGRIQTTRRAGAGVL